MVSAWRNFKNNIFRPLFTIIFRPEMLKFHPYSIFPFHFDQGNNGWICHILCVNRTGHLIETLEYLPFLLFVHKQIKNICASATLPVCQTSVCTNKANAKSYLLQEF